MDAHSLPIGEQRSKMIRTIGVILGALQLEIEEDLFRQYPELQIQFKKSTD